MTGMRRDRYLPWAPIDSMLRVMYGDSSASMSEIAAHSGVGYRSWMRFNRSGRITIGSADRVCVKCLGLHPSLVYGDDWWAVRDVRPT